MKRLGDWRLPLIFAVPILLWAALLYAILQPIPGAGAAAKESITYISPKTTMPVASPTTNVGTYVWPTKQPDTCAHATTGYLVRSVNGVVVEAIPDTVCP